MSYADVPINVEYAAVIQNVQEVTLVGTADLSFWRERLAWEHLFPYAAAGQAELAISATAATWKGIAFKELSFSVAICADAQGGTHDGYYLAHAYNSVALLAFAERLFFKTPYYAGNLDVEAGVPAHIGLADGATPVFSAEMHGSPVCTRQGEEVWQGAIWLPRRGARGSAPARLFYASLGGLTETYAFAPESHRITLDPHPRAAIVRQLIDSDFSAKEWHIRRSATHAKSKTYRRQL